MKSVPKTLPEALNVIRAMHTDLLAFRNPEFDLIASGREGDFDDRVKSVLSHSAPVIKADRHASDCASDVLYPAIEAAMKELQSLHPGFNHAVNRAFNHLHGAFWSECPAPASAATLRPENFQAPDLSMDFGAALNALKAGGRAARTGWNGKGLWLELQVPDAKSKMTLPYIFINYPRDAQNTPGARVPWLASMTDMLADDWVLVE